MGERQRRDRSPAQVETTTGRTTAGPTTSSTAAGLLALQRSAGNSATVSHLHRKETEGTESESEGLPDQLKSSIESLSGIAMDDVRVHYNSPEPRAIKAGAYAQGSEIHVASGQERHLPHEAWHVVQQRGGNVPAGAMEGKPITEDEGLESEADEAGDRARH